MSPPVTIWHPRSVAKSAYYQDLYPSSLCNAITLLGQWNKLMVEGAETIHNETLTRIWVGSIKERFLATLEAIHCNIRNNSLSFVHWSNFPGLRPGFSNIIWKFMTFQDFVWAVGTLIHQAYCTLNFNLFAIKWRIFASLHVCITTRIQTRHSCLCFGKKFLTPIHNLSLIL